MRILLIDDDVTVVENLAIFLRAEFHAVEKLTYIRDKRALREILEGFGPEGVILDYGMEHQGSEVYGWLREWNEKVAIVFYSNYARSQERGQMLKAGAQEPHIVEKREVGLDLDPLLEALQRQI